MLLFLFVGLPILCGVVVWGFFDAGDRPREVWTGAGRSRQFWLWAQAIGIFVPPLVTVVYLLAVRPRLERATPPPAPEGPTGDGPPAVEAAARPEVERPAEPQQP